MCSPTSRKERGFMLGFSEHYNTKIKTYPTGKRLVIFSSRAIFSPRQEELDIVPEFYDVNDILEEYGSEASEEVLTSTEQELDAEEQTPDPFNLHRSVVRAKERIFDIAFCNDWSYFLTITYDDEKINSRNVKEVMKQLASWLHNQSVRNDLRYILIPEYHQSGRIHLHGLINDALEVVDSGTRTVQGFDKPLRLSTIRSLGLVGKVKDVVYNVPSWKYGFSTAVKIHGDQGALATYVTKYMTKASTKIFGKYYWSSSDLTREPKITYTSTTDYQEIDLPEYTIPKIGVGLKYKSELSFQKD